MIIADPDGLTWVEGRAALTDDNLAGEDVLVYSVSSGLYLVRT